MEQGPSGNLRPQLNTNHQNLALFAASLAAFFTAFMTSSLNVALPVINQEFNVDAILLGWVVTSYVLVMAVFSVPFGRMGDIIGIKKMFACGVIVFTVFSAAALFSNSIVMLIICRSLQGLGSAMLTGNSIALVASIFPSKDRGRVFGINVAAVYIGMSVGPSLGGILTESFGWRSIFLINLPVGLLVILLLFWKVGGEWYESKGEKFDYSGSIVYAVALVALIYGFSILPSGLGVGLILAGIFGLLAFFKLETRAKSPVLNIGIFRNNKTLIFSNLAALINLSATTAVVFLLSLYLQYIKALTPEQAGLVLVAQPIVQAVFSPFTGRLSDRLEPRVVSSAGMALTFVGLVLLSFLAENTSILQVVIILIVVGVGLALFSSPNANAIMSSVEPKYYGVASSLVATIRSVGQTMSMGITMIVMALFIGRVMITVDVYPALLTSTHIAFIIFSILCFGGIFAAIYKDKLP